MLTHQFADRLTDQPIQEYHGQGFVHLGPFMSPEMLQPVADQPTSRVVAGARKFDR